MRVCVIGSAGNMGKRYMAILRSLGTPNLVGVDMGEPTPRATHYIIATPTATHLDILSNIIDLHGLKGALSILIEKPVTKNMGLLPFIGTTANKIYMVNQYNYAWPSGRKPAYGNNKTEYNYYNSGADGLGWDCIQLLHMAEGEVELRTDSPRWLCKLNGRWIRRDMVDSLYIRMIKDFITDGKAYGRLWGPDDILAAHKKAVAYEESINRGASQERVYSP